tara:strand:- start:500 stop:820 length:321 start_codon:yes stop_codon:yes gene_type:complete
MYRLIKDDVNKKHSYTWTKLNDDARYELFRKEFIAEFGGEFDTKGVWTEKKVEVERTFLIERPDGVIDEVHNFAKYCRVRELNRSAMYEVLKGKRKQHKGYRIKGD